MADFNFEKLENNQIQMTITVDAEEFEKSVQRAYIRMKPQLQLQGFRKGKVPRSMAEKAYGKELFYNEAVEDVIQNTYPQAVMAADGDVVGVPNFSLEEIGEEGMKYTATVTVKPEVKLGEYDGIKVSKHDTSFTEEEVDTRIGEIRQQHAIPTSVFNRPVRDGDAIKLDFTGTVNGKKFKDGSGKDYPLVIGSGMFIPGFEEQLIGVMPENDATVKATFPDNYAQESLRGKEAVFHCHVKEIIETAMPELDDNFVRFLSEEWSTVEDFRQAVRDQIQDEKLEEAERAKVIEIMDKMVESAEIDVPEVMIDEEAKNMADDFINRIVEQGMSGDQYYDFTGSNHDMLTEEMRPHAEKKVRGKLILEQVAKEQGLTVPEEEVADNLRDFFRSTGQKVKDKDLQKMAGEGFVMNLRSDLLKQKAQNWLAEHAVEE